MRENWWENRLVSASGEVLFPRGKSTQKRARIHPFSGGVLWYLSFAEERKYPAEGSKRISQHPKSKRHLDSADTRYYNETASDSLELPQGGFLKD